MADPVLAASGLTYTYPDGTEALRGVCTCLAAGERVGLIGPNGSGKSTLILCLGGFLVSGGQVRVNGVTLHRRNARAFRQGLGIVFQNADDQLFMPRLWDDVAFGPINQGLDSEQVARRVGPALEQVGLTGLEEKPPHHLSMGQRRSAAIATVLAMAPDVLLLDEPSSDLDPRGRRKLIEQLRSLPAAMLIATHDLLLVDELCERVLLIDDGRIVAEGPTRALLLDAKLLTAHGLEVSPGLVRFC